LIWP